MKAISKKTIRSLIWSFLTVALLFSTSRLDINGKTKSKARFEWGSAISAFTPAFIDFATEFIKDRVTGKRG